MNTTIRPPFVDPEKGKITLMWSKLNLHEREAGIGNEWVPNHIVPLVSGVSRGSTVSKNSYIKSSEEPIRRPDKSFRSANRFQVLSDISTEAPISVQDSDDELPMDLSVIKEEPEFNSNDSTGSGQSVDPASCAPGSHFERKSDSKPDIKSTKSGDVEPLDLSNIKQEPELTPVSAGSGQSVLDPEYCAPVTELGSDLDINSVSVESSIVNDSESSFNHDISGSGHNLMDPAFCAPENDNEFTPGPLKTFMSTKVLIDVFRGPYTILESILIGRKDGNYFVFNNTENMNRRSRGEKSDVWDDCGVWNKSSCPTALLVNLGGKLTTVYQKNDEYCVEKMMKGKRTYVPLTPQPRKEEILELHRTYQTLKASTTQEPFKRRVTYFGNVPLEYGFLPQNVALVEYIGRYPGKVFHGNVKCVSKNIPYLKTKKSVSDQIKEKLQHCSVKGVETIMNAQTTCDFEKQRDEKQIQNFKYQIIKKDSPNSNAADHVIAVEEMLKAGENAVQSVEHIRGLNHPTVTLFDDQHITDIKRFCCREGGEILSLDKTFNLGEFHVTPTVYKDRSVVKRSTLDFPITFGPTFIHTNSSSNTYSRFLQSFGLHLNKVEKDLLVLGSDEEAAFKSSISACFPTSTHVLCTRHLRSNVMKYMEDHSGLHISDRQDIISHIFDKNGIVDSLDDDTYSHRVEQVTNMIKTNGENSTFLNYFNNRLLPLLMNHVIIPQRNGKVSPNWTTNNAESANHILKSATKWKLCDLPKFIKVWNGIVNNERTERERAMRGSGNYKLAYQYQHHLLDISNCANLSKEQQIKKIDKFRNCKWRENQNMVVSKNGQRTIIKTPSAGKKPNQMKRKRAERTRTPSSKRRIID